MIRICSVDDWFYLLVLEVEGVVLYVCLELMDFKGKRVVLFY